MILTTLTKLVAIQVSTQPVDAVATTFGLMCGDGHFGILAEGDNHIAGLPAYDWIVKTIRSVAEPHFPSDLISERLFGALHEVSVSRVCITLAGFRQYQRFSQPVLIRISNLEQHDEGRLTLQTFVKPTEDTSLVLLSDCRTGLSERQGIALEFIRKRSDILEDTDSLSAKLIVIASWTTPQGEEETPIIAQTTRYGRDRFCGSVIFPGKHPQALPVQVIHRLAVASHSPNNAQL